MISRICLQDAECYVPHGHEGVRNHALVGAAAQGIGEVSVWHGAFDPGGESDLHVHEHSVQAYYVLSGRFVVGDGAREWTLGPGETALVPAGDEHFIANCGAEPGTVLVITAPGLR